jgi:hypothetical protein
MSSGYSLSEMVLAREKATLEGKLEAQEQLIGALQQELDDAKTREAQLLKEVLSFAWNARHGKKAQAE